MFLFITSIAPNSYTVLYRNIAAQIISNTYTANDSPLLIAILSPKESTPKNNNALIIAIKTDIAAALDAGYFKTSKQNSRAINGSKDKSVSIYYHSPTKI